MKLIKTLSGVLCLALSALPSFSEIKLVVNHNDNQHASAAFKFKDVPPPSKSDSATGAKFKIIDGERDENGGDLDKLHDGKGPTEEDQPDENFFFSAGTDGGRLLIDLESATEIKQINTYSWHPNTRGPQVYRLFASAGQTTEFQRDPKRGSDPERYGWKLIATVDTRPKSGEPGGQYGVSISDSSGIMGNYRYLLFDMARTENTDDWGNTFYGEIDVVGKNDASSVRSAAPAYVIRSPRGDCEITIDTSEASDLTQWATNRLGPVLAEWYPKIVAMLPSAGYQAPGGISVIIAPGRGVAGTVGTNITANASWLRRELNGEAIGALIHEVVHVVQSYGDAPQRPGASPAAHAPGWLVEGIADYIRWFKYEPQSHGADVNWMRIQPGLVLRYDAGYRVSANFLNYVVETYGQDLIIRINDACRAGWYTNEFWPSITGKKLTALEADWKATLQSQITGAAGK